MRRGKQIIEEEEIDLCIPVQILIGVSSCLLIRDPEHSTKQIWRLAFASLIERAVAHLLPLLQLVRAEDAPGAAACRGRHGVRSLLRSTRYEAV